MRKFFTPTQPASVDSQQTCHSETHVEFAVAPSACDGRFYFSDISSESDGDTVSDDNPETNIDPATNLAISHSPSSGVSAAAIPTATATPTLHLVPATRPLKRCKLDVPARLQRKMTSVRRLEALTEALDAIEKLLKAKKTQFVAGPNGLQAKRTRAIQAHLALMVRNARRAVNASEMAAESHGFARVWGGRQVRSWTRRWVTNRTLPVSLMGCHAKVYSLLDDPDIAAELRAYIRSNKWAMNPQKLADFSKNRLIPDEAAKYVHDLIDHEMPHGLKQYMELELFPHIHLKVGKGVSVATARRWLRREGFQYTTYKKGLYFDGHDRPDVLQYRQQIFLPKMKEYERYLVRYVVGNVELEQDIRPANFVERRIVLCAHDEMTVQSNDATQKSWVFDGEHKLRKKGVGRGIHRSDVICSTVGHLEDAGESLEYGKNYDGYWNGEMFIKQVSTVSALHCYC